MGAVDVGLGPQLMMCTSCRVLISGTASLVAFSWPGDRMPFTPGEEVDLDWTTEDTDNCRLEFLGHTYTVQNLGLTPRRKDRVTCILRLPRQPGKYPYKWTDGINVAEGDLRVIAQHGAGKRTTHTVPATAPAAPSTPRLGIVE